MAKNTNVKPMSTEEINPYYPYQAIAKDVCRNKKLNYLDRIRL